MLELERRLLTTFARIVDKAGETPPTFVLRPIQLTLLVLRLEGQETNAGFWGRLEGMPRIQRLEVSRPGLRELVESLKAGT